MTSKVALHTANKKRKMGYGDFIDDSGVPMDGVELDSSSNAASTMTTRNISDPAQLLSMASLDPLRQAASRQINSVLGGSANNTVTESPPDRLKESGHNSGLSNFDNTAELSTTQNEAMTTSEDQAASLSQNCSSKISNENESPDTGFSRGSTKQASNSDNCNSSKENPNIINNPFGLETIDESDTMSMSTEGQSSSMALGPDNELVNHGEKHKRDQKSLSPTNREAKANSRGAFSGSVTTGSPSKSTLRSFGDLFDDDDLD